MTRIERLQYLQRCLDRRLIELKYATGEDGRKAIISHMMSIYLHMVQIRGQHE